MSYKYTNKAGKVYYLNCGETTLKGSNVKRTNYYFSSDHRPHTACDLPGDKTVVENPRNGVPFCKNK